MTTLLCIVLFICSFAFPDKEWPLYATKYKVVMIGVNYCRLFEDDYRELTFRHD